MKPLVVGWSAEEPSSIGKDRYSHGPDRTAIGGCAAAAAGGASGGADGGGGWCI